MPVFASEKQPNVLFIFPDQWRGSALESEVVIAPNLQEFKRESVNFLQAASNYPVCSPYRAMLMTGQYPFKNQVWGNCQSITAQATPKCELPTEKVCFSDLFKKANYQTAYIGKWHLDAPEKPYVKTRNNVGEMAWNEWCPPARRHGFDFWHAYGTYDDHMNPMYWATDSARDDFKFVKQYGPEYEVDRAIDFLNVRDEDTPFLMVLSMNPPHSGYDLVPQKYKDLYKDLDVEQAIKNDPRIPKATSKLGRHYRQNIKHYYAQISAIDEQFGRLMLALEKRGLKENTIVVFTSDHGNCMGMFNEVAKNNFFEPSMHIPFMLRYPAKIKPNQTDMLFNVPDIYPTLLGLCGLDSMLPADLEGINYASTIFEGKFKGTNAQPYISITDSEVQPEQLSLGRRGVRTVRYSYQVEFIKGVKKETLFDRKEDPFQQQNRVSLYPELAQKFYDLTKKNAKKMSDPFASHM